MYFSKIDTSSQVLNGENVGRTMTETVPLLSPTIFRLGIFSFVDHCESDTSETPNIAF